MFILDVFHHYFVHSHEPSCPQSNSIDNTITYYFKIGVIIPPPDIRAVADKTAQFVAKNGKLFEEKIMNSAEGQTSKFNFMKIYDPYHAYYEMKIREYEEGIVTTTAAVTTTCTESLIY